MDASRPSGLSRSSRPEVSEKVIACRAADQQLDHGQVDDASEPGGSQRRRRPPSARVTTSKAALDLASARPVASDFNLCAFAMVGTAAAEVLERFARLLFIRERELDRERERGDRLLRNVLPDAIIDTVKTREVGIDLVHMAQGYGEVTVLFADFVGFTGQAALAAAPADLVAALDEMWDGPRGPPEHHWASVARR